MSVVYVLSAYEPGVPGSGGVHGVFSSKEKAQAHALRVWLHYYEEWMIQEHVIDAPDEPEDDGYDKQIPAP